MTIEYAINTLTMCQELMLFDPLTGETHELWQENKDNQALYNACIVAITALCEQAERENPQPLTLDELKQLELAGIGIYISNTDGGPIFRGNKYTAAVLDKTVAFGTIGEYRLQAIYGRGLTLAESDYSKTWLAYRHKPKEATT